MNAGVLWCMSKKIKNLINVRLKKAMNGGVSQNNICEMIELVQKEIGKIIDGSHDKQKMMLAVRTAVEASYNEGYAGIISNESLIFATCAALIINLVDVFAKPKSMDNTSFFIIYILCAVVVICPLVVFLITSIKLKRDVESSKLEYLIKKAAVNECIKKYNMDNIEKI